MGDGRWKMPGGGGLNDCLIMTKTNCAELMDLSKSSC